MFTVDGRIGNGYTLGKCYSGTLGCKVTNLFSNSNFFMNKNEPLIGSTLISSGCFYK